MYLGKIYSDNQINDITSLNALYNLNKTYMALYQFRVFILIPYNYYYIKIVIIKLVTEVKLNNFVNLQFSVYSDSPYLYIIMI